MWLTDLPWLLPLTQLNVDANGWESHRSMRPTVAPLRWGHAADAARMPHAVDLVRIMGVALFVEAALSCCNSMAAA